MHKKLFKFIRGGTARYRKFWITLLGVIEASYLPCALLIAILQILGAMSIIFLTGSGATEMLLDFL